VTSLLGTLSLELIIFSCILSPDPTNDVLIPLRILFSILLISGILGVYLAVQTSNVYYHYYIYYPLTRFLFTYYGIISLVISLIAICVDVSILGIISEILWVSSAVLGIVAAIVYRGDEEKYIAASYSPEVRDETRKMYDTTFKIVLFGEPEVARANLTQKFLTNLFVSDSKMTIGVDFEVKTVDVGGKKVKLQLWDFGGKERFKFLLPTYVRGAKGGLFIYDANKESSIRSIDEWLTIIRNEITPDVEFPIMAVGIISDMVNNQQISAEEGIKIAKSRGLDGFIECSVETGENIEETFEALARLILERSNA
ncbi:MAG: Rab family GTPase, partial [Candidatus Hermodarchaeota archaeon]